MGDYIIEVADDETDSAPDIVKYVLLKEINSFEERLLPFATFFLRRQLLQHFSQMPYTPTFSQSSLRMNQMAMFMIEMWRPERRREVDSGR